MKPLSPEQLLAIADEFCLVTNAQVRSFSALCGCAAVAGARMHGVPVFDSAGAAADALVATIAALEPLSADNSGFATLARRVYLDWQDVV